MKYFLLTFAILCGSNAVGSILIPFSPYLGVGAGVIFAAALMELVGYNRGVEHCCRRLDEEGLRWK